MYDSRLIGVWRSDAKRTGRELAARRDIPARSRNGLRRLFGKLELRYTRTRCYATLDGNTESSSYSVIAKDSSSVAIVSYEPWLDAEVISHLHFDGSHVWVAVGTGLFREFFKRVRPSDQRPNRTAAARRTAGSQTPGTRRRSSTHGR
jgi:hypothetical protein